MEREGRILPHHELDEKIERLFHRYWDEEMSEEEQYEIVGAMYIVRHTIICVQNVQSRKR